MNEVSGVLANRQTRKWTRSELAGRLLWGLMHPFFRFSPRPLWSWRRWLLRVFGAQIGSQVHIYPTAIIAIPWTLTIGPHCAVGDRAILYGLGSIRLGARVTVSQGAHLCAGTHDWKDPTMPLIKSRIEIGDDVWVCAEAFVGPDVTIGARSILAARACVMRDVGPDHIAQGNPAVLRPKPVLASEPLAK